MWARVKGRAENALIRLPFKEVLEIADIAALSES
jgi:hypothetical protein